MTDIDPEYGEQLILDPSLAPVDEAITEAFDFRDEVCSVFANKDDGADWPPPTDNDDHGDGDDDGDDDDDGDFPFEEDLVVTVPRHILGKAKVRIVMEIDKR